jgi:hypothetical protein
MAKGSSQYGERKQPLKADPNHHPAGAIEQPERYSASLATVTAELMSPLPRAFWCIHLLRRRWLIGLAILTGGWLGCKSEMMR